MGTCDPTRRRTDRGRRGQRGGGGGVKAVGCLRLHYERFEKLAISQIVFKSNFVF